jgi:Plant calmodulin-binding domain
VDLESPKARKKADPVPHGVRCRSEDIRGLLHHKLADLPINPYLKTRSRPSSVDSQSIPLLKRSPSLSSSRVPRQNRQGTANPAGKSKSGTREETEVGSFTSDHLGYAENGGSYVKEIIEDEISYLHHNKQESMLQIDKTDIKADNISQTSNKDETELLDETGYLDLSFNTEIPSRHNSSEKVEDISNNLPEIETKETITEGSPMHPDSNCKVINENKILEKCEVTEESISEIEKEVTESIPPEKITRDIDEHDKKLEVIDTESEEIDNLYVLSSSNDETDDLREILIENELSKIIATGNNHWTEQEQKAEILIENELSKFIATKNTHCTEQEQKALSIDIMPIVEEIANELEGMEKRQAGDNGDDMHPTWMLKKWNVDYVLQRLIQKLETSNKNQVSKLVQAYESVIQLMMRRKAIPHQAYSK